MGDLEFAERPQLNRTILIAAFSGWSDASESATRAVEYLAREYGARKFAWIDSEDFFDFTSLRPTVAMRGGRGRVINWPTNEFLYASAQESGRDLLFLSGVEPHLHWRKFASLFVEVAEAAQVELVITLGGLLDAVPHTRPAHVIATATSETLGEGFEQVHLPASRYEGPTGIISVVLDLMTRKGVPCVSLWGRAPHYLQVKPNPQVTLALLRQLQTFLPVPLNLQGLGKASDEFLSGLGRALEGQQQIVEHIKQLEEKYDRETPGELSVPQTPSETQALISDLEQFLRQRHGEGDGESNRG